MSNLPAKHIPTKDAVVDNEPRKFDIAVGDLETAKNCAVWGTYGKDGKQPFKYVRLCNCETSHLQAILKTQFQIRGSDYELIIKSILDDRSAPYINPEG